MRESYYVSHFQLLSQLTDFLEMWMKLCNWRPLEAYLFGRHFECLE
jgi:hypothetical protein